MLVLSTPLGIEVVDWEGAQCNDLFVFPPPLGIEVVDWIHNPMFLYFVCIEIICLSFLGIEVVNWEGAQRIMRYEEEEGARLGKTAEKILDPEKMLRVARGDLS